MILRTHPLWRVVDVLVFLLAITLLMMLLSSVAPVYSQVCNTSQSGGNGDMLAALWANGSADGNPNVVDHARYAGQSGSADSASHAGSADTSGYAENANYANNSGGWGGYGFPGGSGYLYYDGNGGLWWGWPSGSGDMSRSVYDTDNNNQVDYAQGAGSAGYADYAGSVGSADNWAGHGWPSDGAGALVNDGSGNLSWVQIDTFGSPQAFAVPAFDQDGVRTVTQSPSLLGLTLRSQSGSFVPLTFYAPEIGMTIQLQPEAMPQWLPSCHLQAAFQNVTETLAYLSDLTVAQEPINNSYVWVIAEATYGDPAISIPGGKYVSSDSGATYVCETDANYYLYRHVESDDQTYWTLKVNGGDGLAGRGSAYPGTGTGFLGKYFNCAMNGGSVVSVISPVALQNDAVKAEPRVMHYHDTVLDQDVALTVLELKPVGL